MGTLLVDVVDKAVNVAVLAEECDCFIRREEVNECTLGLLIKLSQQGKQYVTLYLDWAELSRCRFPDDVLKQHVNMHVKGIRKYRDD